MDGENFEKGLEEGRKKLKNKSGLLVLFSSDNIIKHCVEIKISKHPEGKDIVLIDNQIQESVNLDRFPVSSLSKIQVVRILPKGRKHLHGVAGEHFCAQEINHQEGKYITVN